MPGIRLKLSDPTKPFRHNNPALNVKGNAIIEIPPGALPQEIASAVAGGKLIITDEEPKGNTLMNPNNPEQEVVKANWDTPEHWAAQGVDVTPDADTAAAEATEAVEAAEAAADASEAYDNASEAPAEGLEPTGGEAAPAASSMPAASEPSGDADMVEGEGDGDDAEQPMEEISDAMDEAADDVAETKAAVKSGGKGGAKK